LTKQVAALKERQRKLTMEISEFETEQHTLKRETSTLATQVEATQYSNAKLHVLVPTTISTTIEEEASSKYPKPKDPIQHQTSTTTTRTRRSEVRVPPRDTDKPILSTIEEKQTTHDDVTQETQDTHHDSYHDYSLDSKDRDIDFDKLEKDLDTKVNIEGDLGNLEDLVRESEGNQKDDPDNTIVIDE